jgi:hypothetical protein
MSFNAKFLSSKRDLPVSAKRRNLPPEAIDGHGGEAGPGFGNAGNPDRITIEK